MISLYFIFLERKFEIFVLFLQIQLHHEFPAVLPLQGKLSTSVLSLFILSPYFLFIFHVVMFYSIVIWVLFRSSIKNDVST